ncbi:MAG: 3-mercaptopyruvate sulfurtransferase [Acetobacteraceae bacterium]|nr:3-mercaptopyruvate sulfurtransferase [Acetobacteraceae bacterium]
MSARGFANPEALIDAKTLAACLGASDLVVIDITKSLPNENRDDRAAWREAHIPGAQFLDIDEVADRTSPLPHMLPAPCDFARMIAAFGIGHATRVVFYDQKGMSSAARGWWMMRVFGHDRAAVLDGGLPAWRAAGFPIESGDVAPPPPARFEPSFRPALVAGLAQVRQALAEGSALLIDARPAARFRGEAPEPRPGIRGGHVPGARSLPHLDLLDDTGRFRPASDLRARLAQAGLDGSRPAIAMCGSGVTACAIALAAHLVGLPDVAVYDGSWTEWGGRSDTPIETG